MAKTAAPTEKEIDNVLILREWLERFSEEMSDYSSDYRQGYIAGFSRACSMVGDFKKPTAAA